MLIEIAFNTDDAAEVIEPVVDALIHELNKFGKKIDHGWSPIERVLKVVTNGGDELTVKVIERIRRQRRRRGHLAEERRGTHLAQQSARSAEDARPRARRVRPAPKGRRPCNAAPAFRSWICSAEKFAENARRALLSVFARCPINTKAPSRRRSSHVDTVGIASRPRKGGIT